jgi:hypothetical protein
MRRAYACYHSNWVAFQIDRLSCCHAGFLYGSFGLPTPRRKQVLIMGVCLQPKQHGFYASRTDGTPMGWMTSLHAICSCAGVHGHG